MGANGGEANKAFLDHIVPELPSGKIGKIHKEVTHAWLSFKNSSTFRVKTNLIYTYKMLNSPYGLITGWRIHLICILSFYIKKDMTVLIDAL